MEPKCGCIDRVRTRTVITENKPAGGRKNPTGVQEGGPWERLPLKNLPRPSHDQRDMLDNKMIRYGTMMRCNDRARGRRGTHRGKSWLAGPTRANKLGTRRPPGESPTNTPQKANDRPRLNSNTI